jgi:Family of unknown function (DUF6510)
MTDGPTMDARSIEQRLADTRDDPALDLVLDGNAIAGLLEELFGAEMTASPGRCAHCDTVSIVGQMRVYAQGPGIVVRCPACTDVVLRVVETPSGTMVDMRGIAALRFIRT